MNKIKQRLKKWFGGYTEKDLVSFGLYLLSEQRANRIKQNADVDSSLYEDKKRRVYDADLANWRGNG